MRDLVTRVKYIIVHPGAAHRDDMLSIAVALAIFDRDLQVYRREPTPEELENPEVLVLDCGGRHERERLNFDHHQFPREAPPECALSLLVRHLGLEEQFQLQPWWQTTITLDAKGPVAAARALGLEQLPRELLSPVEETLLRLMGGTAEFGGVAVSQDGRTENAEPLGALLYTIGVQLLSDVRAYASAYAHIGEVVWVTSIGGVECLICDEALTPALAGAMGRWREREHPGAAVSIARSDREGESWVLYRYEDHPQVDFNRIGEDSRVVFAHRGGFIAKLAPGVDSESALELVKAAVV